LEIVDESWKGNLRFGKFFFIQLMRSGLSYRIFYYIWV